MHRENVIEVDTRTSFSAIQSKEQLKDSLTFISPAKINLFLRILGRRPDGYHELASLFQAIDLHDTLTFTLADTDHLDCSSSIIPTDRSNLIWKAVDLFRRKTGLPFAIHIDLEKRIPIEAGLGGGSSNAATTLWAVNELLGRPASEDQLTQWSGEIGSDIPFFFSSGTAYCTGRGEIVKSLSHLSRPTRQPDGADEFIWIVKPQQGLSTPQVYGRLDLPALEPRDPLVALTEFANGTPYYFNDLEEAAFVSMPSLRLFKQHLLDSGFEFVMLSGSGSSFVCIGGIPKGLDAYFHRQVGYCNRQKASWY